MNADNQIQYKLWAIALDKTVFPTRLDALHWLDEKSLNRHGVSNRHHQCAKYPSHWVCLYNHKLDEKDHDTDEYIMLPREEREGVYEIIIRRTSAAFRKTKRQPKQKQELESAPLCQKCQMNDIINDEEVIELIRQAEEQMKQQ